MAEILDNFVLAPSEADLRRDAELEQMVVRISKSIKCVQSCPRCGADSSCWVSDGYSRPVASAGGARRQQLKCRKCSKRIRCNHWSMNHRFRHRDPAMSSKVLQLMSKNISLRGVARMLGVSLRLIEVRWHRLARRALEYHFHQMQRLGVQSEGLCLDGFENFAGSQYDVNNINHMIGEDSLFVYDWGYAAMNRKGRMSEAQKLRRSAIEAQRGRYDPSDIRSSVRELLERELNRQRMKGQSSPRILLLSDEHFQYKRAIRRDLPGADIQHITVSSEESRTYKNILFPVNNFDLMLRKDCAAFAKETISFAKKAGAMCLRYALKVVEKNYLQTAFTKCNESRPWAGTESPAMQVGLAKRVLDYVDIYSERSLGAPAGMNEEWRAFYQGEVAARSHRSHVHIKKEQVPRAA